MMRLISMLAAPRSSAAAPLALHLCKPQLVADCVSTMGDAVAIPVTVKCRTVVFSLKAMAAATRIQNSCADAIPKPCIPQATNILYLHAATPSWEANPCTEPRNTATAARARATDKSEFPQLELIMNGGINSCDNARELMHWADGVMIGRSAYNPIAPASYTRTCMTHLFASTRPTLTRYKSLYAASISRRRALATVNAAFAAQL